MTRAALVAALLVFLAGGFLRAFAEDAPAAAAQVKLADLDVRLQQEVVDKARGFLDPTVEFTWRPRKDLLAAFDDVQKATGIAPLADIPFLRDIVDQGRSFKPRFSNQAWLRETRAHLRKTRATYWNLTSETRRLTYALPRSYPAKRAFAKIPRAAPYPLLVAVHEAADAVDAEGQPVAFPGAAALERCYPKNAFADLYARWLLLAPVAPRGRFLEEDGSVRHEYLTLALTEFWRRYHVDFDRIVLDGAAPAAALAATFPHVFAGLVLRGGEATLETEVVPNYAAVPVFVVDRPELAATLREAGHPDVSVGSSADVPAWLSARRRRVPRSFHWRMLRDDHKYPNWIVLGECAEPAAKRTLSVQVTDRQDGSSTIRIDAVGVEPSSIFLNDEIVDLDRPVRFTVNGESYVWTEVERDINQTFTKDPNIRENMNFGWLYPVRIDELEGGVPGTPASDADARPSRAAAEAEARRWWEFAERYRAHEWWARARVFYEKVVGVGESSLREPALARLADMAPPSELTPQDRLEIQKAFLLGRLDRLGYSARFLVHPDDLFPFALRDLWWRRTTEEAIVEAWRAVAERAEGIVRDRYLWLLGGGERPFPEVEGPHPDTWPILTALILDRASRETRGMTGLPAESPLMEMEVPETWRAWWPDARRWTVEEAMDTGYRGVGRAEPPGDDTSESPTARNAWLAALLGALLLGLAIRLGRGPRRRTDSVPKAHLRD